MNYPPITVFKWTTKCICKYWPRLILNILNGFAYIRDFLSNAQTELNEAEMKKKNEAQNRNRNET